MEGFESCSYIEHGMVLDHCNRIRSCNNFNPRYGGRPIIYENYHGEKIDWKEFFEIKRELRNKYRNNSCPELCKNCVNTAYKNWDDEVKRFFSLMLSTKEASGESVSSQG